MYCCRSEKHAGQLQRAMEVAQRLSDTFDVTVLLSDASPGLVRVPDNIEVVSLPALGFDPDASAVDIDGSRELKDLIVARRDVMLGVFERLKPRVVAIENYPFTQRRLRGEVLPLIERAHNGIYGESLVVCITNAILVDEPNREEMRADRAADLLDRYFDMVVVHSDPVFARIEEFFQPENTLHTPLYHTGFVTDEGSAMARQADAPANTILVSAGDGRHGGALYRAAVEAHGILGSTSALPMKIVAGERLPEGEWQELMTAAEEQPGLTLERSVSDLRQEMAQARWSVSQCGYNTAVDALCARIPSLFVPCGNGQRREQIVRAQRLVYWGAGRLLMPHHLNGASLANEIHQLVQFEPRRINFDLNGASNTAELISRAVYHNDFSPVSIKPNADGRRPR